MTPATAIADTIEILRLEDRLKRRYWRLFGKEERFSARTLAQGVRIPEGFTEADVLEVAKRIMLELYRNYERRHLQRIMRGLV